MNDWHAPELEGVKVFDFATSLGPIVITPDEYEPGHVDFGPLIAYAGRNTRLLPGEVIAAAPGHRQEPVRTGDVAEVSLPPFGVLRSPVT
jgi:hypothetical protein